MNDHEGDIRRTITMEPIGVIRTPYSDRSDAPRQPGTARQGAEGAIELYAGRNFEQALADLHGFEFIWVIYWFDRNDTWRPKVLPPRGDGTRRGLFATRSPHRPNPIGLSLLRLLKIRGRTLRVGDVDILDGTPVLDIKPYLPYVEAHPYARAGWLDSVAASEELYSVDWNENARRQLAWLAAHGVYLELSAHATLQRTPFPHPYRRIRERSDGTLELSVKSWRVIFHLEGRAVRAERIESGYAPEAVRDEAAAAGLHDGPVHVLFHREWGDIG
ncbi:MAG: tRNA (N6-threonylcarbamoyladenosine(37)-N6)-methyltransferase TrmO [Bacteroidetes bacterium]|nr:tRNA (N6-threonylcarbamoyladenosine(37)-N6)-methyltransferase TrmO [Bacteroidota bacterium]